MLILTDVVVMAEPQRHLYRWLTLAPALAFSSKPSDSQSTSIISADEVNVQHFAVLPSGQLGNVSQSNSRQKAL
jgi:hypothetical protein